MRRQISFTIILTALLCIPFSAFSQDFPTAIGYVNDFANLIPQNIENKITAICQEVQQKTGAQIAVVTVETVGNEHYTEYANKLFEKWNIGQKGQDNGILIFHTKLERSFRIEIGYGLEGIIPDGLAGQIRDDYVFPNFKKNKFGAGHLAAVMVIAGIIAKDAGVEITGAVQPARRRVQRRSSGGSFAKFIIIALIFLFFRGGGRRRGGLLPLLLLGGLMSGGGGRSNYGGFGGGGGGFGGGFGGFGGGMSGGGGAGGSY